MSALLRLGALPQREWDDALEEMLRIDAAVLAVERVSYWSLRSDPPSIVCELGYVGAKRLFERGTALLEPDCPAYFTELGRVQVIAIDDATTDARVSCLASYLRARGVGALLDVPVFARGALVGILCHEHVGGRRRWTTHERELAVGVAQAMTARLEARARTHAEEAERRSAFLAHASATLARTLDARQAQEVAVRAALPTLGEMATLIRFDGSRAWRTAEAHVTPEGGACLATLTGRYGGDIEGPGIGVQALREQQSLLIPSADPQSLRAYGLEEDHIALLARLRVRSVMSVLVRARGEITGVLTFAATARAYGRDELQLAETYASQVGVQLANVELYHRAQDAVRARDEFLSLAAHELRTPLAALTFSAEVLAKEAPRDASSALRRALAIMRRQTKRLTRLSDLVIVASQSDTSDVPVSMETIDVAALVREVATDYEDTLGRAGCPVELSADSPVLIRGDRAELKVVIANLLDNAMKFGAGRPVEVSVHAPDGKAEVVVRDHGIGIPEEQHAHLFCRFERGVSARHFGGLGLGLHIASRIVAAHGGSIRAGSHAGEGAEVIIELPRDGAAAGAQPALEEWK